MNIDKKIKIQNLIADFGLQRFKSSITKKKNSIKSFISKFE